jgi:Spy/CpxP family protein refolding chaperone
MIRLTSIRKTGTLLSLFMCASMGLAGLNPAQAAEVRSDKADLAVGGGEHHMDGKKWDGQKHGHGGKHCGIMKQLNLTEDQKSKLKAQHESFRSENAATLSTLKAKREQLKQLGSDPANEAQRKALRSELRDERHKLMEKHRAMMKTILTPEQSAQLDKAKAQCKAEFKANRKPGEVGHGPGGRHHDLSKEPATPVNSH